MTTRTKTYKQCQEAYETLLTELVSQWWRKACANPCELIYLFGLCGENGTGIWSHLWVGRDIEDNPGIPLRPEPLPRNVTREHLRELLRGILNREPLYVFAD